MRNARRCDARCRRVVSHLEKALDAAPLEDVNENAVVRRVYEIGSSERALQMSS